MEKEKCKSCPFPKDKSKIIEVFWQEGESKFKWNKAGTNKCFYYICELCGNKQEFMPV